MNMEWLENFTGDALAAHEFALIQFSKLALHGNDRLQWLVSVDTALNAQQHDLAKEYAHARRLSTEDEARLWHAGHTFHEACARAYLTCLQDASIAPTSAISLAVRMLHHRGRAAVWRHFRYLQAPIGWWLDLHKFYALAEREGFVSKPAVLYPEEAPVNCETLYLQTILLDTLNLTNMTRPQILATDRWLHAHIGTITLNREFDETNQLFYVDLDLDRGGRRIRNLQPAPNQRYWQPDVLVAEIERVMQGQAGSNAPDADVLRGMHAEWSRTSYKRQRRAATREEASRRATVAHGIYAACQEVLSQATGRATALLDCEIWHIESASRHGIGAVVSTELNNWLEIGRLIVLREEISFGMSVVGVIRNLKHQEAGKIYVGAEILSYMALYGSLQPARAVAGSHNIPCIFIASDDEHRLKFSLLIPAIEYEAEAEFFLRLDNRLHRIRFHRLIEQKDDWVRVEIEVLKHLVAVPKTATVA